VPLHPFLTNRYVCNMSDYGPMGRLAGAPTGEAIWDSGSWGQYLGGTTLFGYYRNFTDPMHIIGQAIRMNPGMAISWQCVNRTIPPLRRSFLSSVAYKKSANPSSCFTAPFVRFSSTSQWTPIINLHIHSKLTDEFRSVFCEC
jgi:hypothetical protein